MLSPLAQVIEQQRWWRVFFIICVMSFCVDIIFLQHGRISSEAGGSLRQIIFVALMFTAVIHCRGLRQLPVTTLVGLLILGLVLPGIWGALGIANGHPVADVINDANGHLFYLLGFAFLLGYRKDLKVWSIMDFAMTLVAVLCVLSLITYGYALVAVDNANRIETFLRTGDYGFLNVFVDGRPYRLFLSSYLFVPIMICYGLQQIIDRARQGRGMDVRGAVFVVLGLAVLVISQTRSLWLGLFAGLAIVVLYGTRAMPLRVFAGALLIGLISVLMLLFFAPQLLRLSDADGNVNMRLGQALVLLELFHQKPWLGWGFGAVVDMPAIVDRPASFSHEMDLIDLVRKIGLIGLTLYLLAFGLLLRSVWRLFTLDNHAREVGGVLMTLAVVFSVGFFNPYATASIGIGAILLALVTAEFGLRAQT